MCYSVLEELNKVKNCEQERNISIPKPYYFFVQKFGRSPEAELPVIAKTFGNGSWFSFYTENKKKDTTMLNRFIMEAEKYAELGKVFQGYVLVEFTGEEEPKELYELLSYIKQNEKQFHCIFTTKMLDQAEKIQGCLEQHFFVRKMEGKKYESAEQSAIFLRVLMEYGFEMDGLTNEAEKLFSDVCWEETDMVQNRIENLARNLAYNKMLEPEAVLTVTAEEAEEAIRQCKKEPETTRRIGFVRGE